ncbi:hypothetical protein K1719_036817 [Acacia pycnantha]|nr:hypothetical protein K1719_036817 [Acacia pycnantha]
MSWQSYVDEHLMCEAVEGHTLSHAITDNGGAALGSSSPFPRVLRFSLSQHFLHYVLFLSDHPICFVLVWFWGMPHTLNLSHKFWNFNNILLIYVVYT